MTKLTINPITRIEGHGRVTIQLDDAGEVASTEFQVTQLRGFEKFTEGRPYYEMPSITSRICGICPISHLLASAKACDAIMSVGIPPAAARLREIVHCGQFIQSHALSFFHLSAPDLLLGMDSAPARRNILGVLADHPEIARDGIALRQFGQQVIEWMAGERIHPSWIVPGGVNAPLASATRDRILAELPNARAIAQRTLRFFQGAIAGFADEIAAFGNAPTMYAGLTDIDGRLQLYEGRLRFVDAQGRLAAHIDAHDYAGSIGEAVLPNSYLKAPYYIPLGYPDGVYRVGPLARLNVAQTCGTPQADLEFAEFHQRCGAPAQSAFHYHYARLVEIIYALERMEQLLADPAVLDTHVRAHAGVNSLEGIGMIEAPRGVLIHHYKVDEKGAIRWANLIVATGHNNLALNRSIEQVSRRFIHGNRLQEGMLNRVSAVVRAYDPCLSCSTHTLGGPALRIELRAPNGSLLDCQTTC